jgi:hypothetical protein
MKVLLRRPRKAGRISQRRPLVQHAFWLEEAIRQKEERKAKEQQLTDEKERKAALRGLVGFGKMIWKEFQMGKDVFE